MLGLARLEQRRPEAAIVVRIALALWAGWLASLALPPFGLFFAQWPAYAAVIIALGRARTRWGGFGVGWAFAFGYHLFGLSWVGEAFLVDAERFGWMQPFAIIGLPAGLAILTGLAGAAFVWVRRRAPGSPVRDALLFAALFMASEWLRGNILTGFPWNLPVHGWDSVLPVLQATAWLGPYGVSLLVVLAGGALLPALAPGPPLRKAAGALMLILPLAAAAGAGSLRLSSAPASMPVVDGVKLRLVQPSIPQREKWRPDLRAAHFEKHLQLSRDAAAAGVTHVIWPEAATPFLVTESPAALEQIARVAPPGGAVILGTPRRLIAQGGDNGRYRHANSVIVVSDTGQIVSTYDKHHLVPFGEYVPLRQWLPLERLAPGHGSFSEGPGPRTIPVPGAPPFSPMICYEAIFPDAVVDSNLRPGWLLNLTNDAWFGTSAGPHQHLAAARLRSIEEGLPLVRVASTGISTVIDAYGRIQVRLDIGEEGFVDVHLPIAIPAKKNTITFNLLFAVMIGIVLFGSLWRTSAGVTPYGWKR